MVSKTAYYDGCLSCLKPLGGGKCISTSGLCIDCALGPAMDSLAFTAETLEMLQSPAAPPLPTSCKKCHRPFTLIQAAFAFEGLCATCYDDVHGPKCHRCGKPTDFQLNGKPTCPGCMAKEKGIGAGKPAGLHATQVIFDELEPPGNNAGYHAV